MLAGRGRRQRGLGLLQLLSISATATALSLSNFQTIASPGVSIGCIVAYNQQIAGCVKDDFKKGNACTPACVTGLTKVQASIQAICEDVLATPSSVLDRALQGQLVPLLCPKSTFGLTTSSLPVNQAPMTSLTTTSKTTSKTQPTTTSKQTTAETSTFSPFTSVSSNIVPSTTIDVESSTTFSTETSTSTSSIVEQETSSAQPTQSSQVTQPSSTAPSAAQDTPNPQAIGKGRGGPFDSAVTDSAGSLSSQLRPAMLAMTILVIFLQH